MILGTLVGGHRDLSTDTWLGLKLLCKDGDHTGPPGWDLSPCVRMGLKSHPTPQYQARLQESWYCAATLIVSPPDGSTQDFGRPCTVHRADGRTADPPTFSAAKQGWSRNWLSQNQASSRSSPLWGTPRTLIATRTGLVHAAIAGVIVTRIGFAHAAARRAP